MKNYILLNRMQIQNANAVSGLTWGFPAITHFLGFVHNLARKLPSNIFEGIILSGCAVIAHEQQVHTYENYGIRFTQNRTPPYLASHEKAATPPIIEEGKMNMTVSLLIEFMGNLGNKIDSFIEYLKKTCLMQRLAGGNILEIGGINIFGENQLKDIKRTLLPGFLLMDRSDYLQEQLQENSEAELLDAWLDFIAIKKKARPESNLINKHLKKLIRNEPKNKQYKQLVQKWEEHQQVVYEQETIADELKNHFNQLESNKENKNLMNQWKEYCHPSKKTRANWEYIKKPKPGYLVPIMTGYKAISKVYLNSEVKNTRDNETDVCFVESVHSIGEWLSLHRIRTFEELNSCFWHYHYEPDWYLCRQNHTLKSTNNDELEIIEEDFEQDFE